MNDFVYIVQELVCDNCTECGDIISVFHTETAAQEFMDKYLQSIVNTLGKEPEINPLWIIKWKVN